ncbi:hypothetical protein GHJ84_24200 [Sinorhizobium meliloti]|uniref:sulfotransferase family 2 domain-containing protein n=1 Tax=Rhizobium meliloti TaxID=382 RepID=UPI00129581BB|nr:sulfotransferase family 2 domain-containing protein [Sinorhizobium meliloti]MQX23998.1 hypothetical protein [Sinorhizobium meliloti]
MLFLQKQKLVFLSVPKTASTSVQHALLPYSNTAFTAPPSLKHMGYSAFLRDVAPVLQRDHGLARLDYIIVAVMREPLSWVHSWYRYRSRDALKDQNEPNRHNYSGHVSFSEFARAYCAAEPPPYATIGNQLNMLLGSGGQIGVDLIFPYEHLENLAEFLSNQVGATITLPKLNESPSGKFTLEPETEALLRQKLRPAIALHDRLRPDGRLTI